MADTVRFDLCPETGIGCVMINQDADMLKIDLMPDEAADLRNLVQSGDMAGARTLLAGVDSRAAALDDQDLSALAEKVY